MERFCAFVGAAVDRELFTTVLHDKENPRATAC